jgi:hypothetical protein
MNSYGRFETLGSGLVSLVVRTGGLGVRQRALGSYAAGDSRGRTPGDPRAFTSVTALLRGTSGVSRVTVSSGLRLQATTSGLRAGNPRQCRASPTSGRPRLSIGSFLGGCPRRPRETG